MYIFNCGKEWWNSLNDRDKERWLDWAVSCGAERNVNLIEKDISNPNFSAGPSIDNIKKKISEYYILMNE